MEEKKSTDKSEKRKSVRLSKVISDLKLETLYIPENTEPLIYRSEINRPAFALTGFFDDFEEERMQLIGNAEFSYLSTQTHDVREKKIADFMALCPAAVVFTTGLEVYPEIITYAQKYGIPVLRTSQTTSAFMAILIAYLQVCLAPSITRHGVLVELYGEGVLIIGESGIGKSETAIELVKRGHRLIADDAVEIMKMSSKTLVGKSPELIKYYAELRGIGVVDIRRTFGMGAVNDTQKIDMVVSLETWDPNKFYDRIGIEKEEIEILGINLPKVTIPVSPGRNLSIIIEIAAMTNREKKMGYNTAEEFFKRTVDQANGAKFDD